MNIPQKQRSPHEAGSEDCLGGQPQSSADTINSALAGVLAGQVPAEESRHESDVAIAYSRGFGNHDNTPDQRTAQNFSAFLEAILTDRGNAKRQQWISGAFAVAPDDQRHQRDASQHQVIGRPHRCGTCVLPRRWIGLDVDESTPETFDALVTLLRHYSGCVYTTASHNPAAPRFRVILELNLAAARNELVAATAAFRQRMDAALAAGGHAPLTWDTSCDRPEQPLYLPLTQAQVYLLDGAPLALDELLADTPPPMLQKLLQTVSVPSVGSAPTAWAMGALEGAVRAVEFAPPGSRNNVLNKEAYSMGGFIASGQLSEELVERELFEATRRAGYETPNEDLRKIRDGITAGMMKPRTDGLPIATAANDAALVEVPIGDVGTAHIEPPQFVIAPIIPRRVATLLGGHGGLGKSMLGLILCAHVACGRSWASFEVRRGKAVFISLEDAGDLVRFRLRCIIDRYQLPEEEVVKNLRVFDGTEMEAALMAEASNSGVVRLVDTPALAQVSAAIRGADLAVIDNASDAYGGGENIRTQVRAFMRRLADMAKTNDGGLVLLAHIDKAAARYGAQGNNYSGSTAWHNSARSRLALVEENGGIELRHEKANLSHRIEPLVLTRDEDGVLVPLGEDGARVDADEIVAAADANFVYDVLMLAIRDEITVPVACSGPVTGWHALRNLPELGKQYRTPEGKRRVLSALTRLSREGRIVKKEYKKANRHTGERWGLPS